MKFYSTPNTSVQRGAYVLHFKISVSIFCCPLFFEEYLNLQVTINKRVNEHTVDYCPSPSGLTSRITPLLFLWTPQGLPLSRIFVEFFLKYVYPTVVGKNFLIFLSLSLLENAFISQKGKSTQFNSWPQAKLFSWFLSAHPRQKEITHFPRQHFLKIYSLPAERREEEEKPRELNLCFTVT